MNSSSEPASATLRLGHCCNSLKEPVYFAKVRTSFWGRNSWRSLTHCGAKIKSLCLKTPSRQKCQLINVLCKHEFMKSLMWNEWLMNKSWKAHTYTLILVMVKVTSEGTLLILLFYFHKILSEGWWCFFFFPFWISLIQYRKIKPFMGIKMKESFKRSKNITPTLPRLIWSKFPWKA